MQELGRAVAAFMGGGYWSFVGLVALLTVLAETLGVVMGYFNLRGAKHHVFANYIALSSDEPISDADYAVLRAKLRKRVKRGGIALGSSFGSIGVFLAMLFFFAGSASGTDAVLYTLIALPVVALWATMGTAPPMLLYYSMERYQLERRHARAGQAA